MIAWCAVSMAVRGVRRHMTQRDEAVRLAVGQQHVCRPSQGGSQRAQFELSQDRMLCAMLLVLLRCDQVTKV